MSNSVPPVSRPFSCFKTKRKRDEYTDRNDLILFEDPFKARATPELKEELKKVITVTNEQAPTNVSIPSPAQPDVLIK